MLDQCHQLQQIVNPQARPPGRGQHERVNVSYARPLSIHATELARFVVVVDAVLAPCPAPVHDGEDLPEQRMEGVRDLEELHPISQIGCS